MAEHRHAAIIGAQRSGSTLLARILGSHPDVIVAYPERPEPKFFLRSGDHDEYHQAHFKGGGYLFLEKSTTYLERPDAVLRMRAIPGGVWPIVILRDPVERAVSNWRFSKENGLETLPAEEALTEAAEGRPFPHDMSTSPFHYLRRSRYGTLLSPWLSARGRDGMSILLYEKLISSPEIVVAALDAELGLPVITRLELPVVNATNDANEVDASTLKRLRATFRAEAESVLHLVPCAARLWPTIVGDT